MVDCREIEFSEEEKKLYLELENVSGEQVYVKPSLRKIVFSSANEWKQNISQEHYMAASRASVIKKYRLIGESSKPLKLNPGEKRRIEYQVLTDDDFRSFDNIRVDCECGFQPQQMKGTSYTTLPLKMSEKQENESKQPAEKIEIREISLPVRARCSCCEEVQSLHWVMGGMPVCDDCGVIFKSQGAKPEAVEEEVDFDVEDFIFEQEEFTDALKDRHQDILKLLDTEDKMTASQVAGKLKLSVATARKDLRFLYEATLLDRVRIGRTFQYFSLRDREQIYLQGEEPEDEDNTYWT